MNQSNKNPFIVQTALDYDMEYHEVECVYNIFRDNFYEKLEELVKIRCSK